MTNGTTKAGIATVVGAPNVGKSTLLNRLVGQKLAITSPKPQSTRDRIVGIRTEGDTQIVFFDTPGLLTPAYELQRAMRAPAPAPRGRRCDYLPRGRQSRRPETPPRGG